MPKQTHKADEPAPGTTLERLYEGTRQQLLLEAGVFSQLSDHMGEKGRANEDHLRNVLRGFLPHKMGLGTGFVEAPHNRRSRQQDIIISEIQNNFPLYEGDSWSIYPVEMVYATIEVKTSLNKDRLIGALRDCAQIRSMSNDKRYLKENIGAQETVEYIRQTYDLPPRFFLFSYSSTWSNFKSFEKAAIESSQEVPEAHLHGLCVLDKSWFFAKRAYKSEFVASQQDGWIKFVSKLHLDCESMRLSDLGITDWSRYLSQVEEPVIASGSNTLSSISIVKGSPK